MKLKLRTIGKATVVLPEEFLKCLDVKGNDLLLAVEVPSGYFLTRYDEIVEQQLKLGLEFIRDYKQTFRALAKRD